MACGQPDSVSHMCDECPGYKQLWRSTSEALAVLNVQCPPEQVAHTLIYGGAAYAGSTPAAAVRGAALHAWHTTRAMANLPEGARVMGQKDMRKAMRRELARYIALDFRAATRGLHDRPNQTQATRAGTDDGGAAPPETAAAKKRARARRAAKKSADKRKMQTTGNGRVWPNNVSEFEEKWILAAQVHRVGATCMYELRDELA